MISLLKFCPEFDAFWVKQSDGFQVCPALASLTLFEVRRQYKFFYRIFTQTRDGISYSKSFMVAQTLKRAMKSDVEK